MGYGDWTQITVKNTSNVQLLFQHSSLLCGEFYSCEDGPDKDKIIEPCVLNTKVVQAQGSYTIGACGHEKQRSGAEGQFDLYEPTSNVVVSTIKFYSPHDTSYNAFSIDHSSKSWSASQQGAYIENDGPLGEVTVTVANTA